jgi:hypothetical protein
MDLLSFIPDNITEVLVKIIRFTELREAVLRCNIKHGATFGYMPTDLPVTEFAQILNEAVSEHLRCGRLLFRDTANVVFCQDGQMSIRPVVDQAANELLQANPDAYLGLQRTKLLENSLNRKVSQQLLKHSCSAIMALCEPARKAAAACDGAPEMSSRANTKD